MRLLDVYILSKYLSYWSYIPYQYVSDDCGILPIRRLPTPPRGARRAEVPITCKCKSIKDFLIL